MWNKQKCHKLLWSKFRLNSLFDFNMPIFNKINGKKIQKNYEKKIWEVNNLFCIPTRINLKGNVRKKKKFKARNLRKEKEINQN